MIGLPYIGRGAITAQSGVAHAGWAGIPWVHVGRRILCQCQCVIAGRVTGDCWHGALQEATGVLVAGLGAIVRFLGVLCLLQVVLSACWELLHNQSD